MPDLQDIDRLENAALDQVLLDRPLGVAGQQRAEPAVAQQRHDRAVVDITLGRSASGIGFARIQNLERDAITQIEPLSGPCADELRA